MWGVKDIKAGLKQFSLFKKIFKPIIKDTLYQM